ncbi:MAG: AAA family ATPase [Phycisphaeraceae bacterium]
MIEILLYRKWTVFFWLLIGVGLGAVYHQYAPVKYESRAEIFVLRANPEAPASPLSSSGLSTSAPSTHAAMLLSTAVLEQAMDDPTIAKSALLEGVEHPLYYLRKELKVSASDETETISIRFVGENPQEAAALISAVVYAYFDQQGIPVRGMTPQEDDQPTTSMLDEQVIASQLMFLSQELSEAKIESGLARSRRDRAVAAGRDINQLQQLLQEAGGDAQTIGLVNLLTINAQLSRLDQQLRSMPSSWAPNHRMRRQVQGEYDELSDQFLIAEHIVLDQAMAHMESAYHQAESHRADLEATFTQLQAKADAARPSPVRVIDAPRVATKKSSPVGAKSYGVGLIFGLFLGCCFAVRAELRNPRTADASLATSAMDDAPDALAAPVNALMRTQDDLDKVETVREIPLLGSVPALHIGDRLTSPDFTSTASSLHQVRAVLQIQARMNGTRSYAFTSPRRGAGKTSITIGVASSLAIAGTRTLVVDCDLAARIVRGQVGRPANPGHIEPFGPIDREIGSPESQSLDDIAVGQGYITDAQNQTPAPSEQLRKVGVIGMLEGRPLADCAVEATVDGLWLLPASEAETHHIGMMSDAFIRDLLEQARDQFDLVLFDTGPVPGSVEALLVTSQADGAIIVVPQGESSKALDRTMSYLKVVGAKVIGTVFNNNKPAGPGSFEEAAGKTDKPGDSDDAYADDEFTNGHQHANINEDIDDAMGSVPLGSGILAAAVFADKESGFGSDGWELKGTSDFPGDTAPHEDDFDGTRPIVPSDILPKD